MWLPLLAVAGWTPRLPDAHHHRPAPHIELQQTGPVAQRCAPHPTRGLFVQPHRGPLHVARSQQGVLQGLYGEMWWVTYVRERRRPVDPEVVEPEVYAPSAAAIRDFGSISGLGPSKAAALLEQAAGDFAAAMQLANGEQLPGEEGRPG